MNDQHFLSSIRQSVILTRVLPKLTGQNYKITPFERGQCDSLSLSV